MHIATFNINDINRRLPNLLDWLAAAKPGVVCLQELKAQDRHFPEAALRDAGYSAVWQGERTWNGVAILARGTQPVLTRRSLPGDPGDKQARYIEAAVNGVLIGCIYLPNGNPQPGPKFDYKLAWFVRLIAHAAMLFDTNAPVILAGDFNVVPTDFDIYPTKSYAKNALVQPAPRARFRTLLEQGWTDALRSLHPDKPMYTFWAYLREAWPRDAGLRLDHLLLNQPAAARLAAAGVDREVRGENEASDHAPAWVRLKRATDSGPGVDLSKSAMSSSSRSTTAKHVDAKMPALCLAKSEGTNIMNLHWSILLSVVAIGAFPVAPMADSAVAPEEVPAKALPVPTADISPEMQKFIGKPLNPDWNQLWKTGAEARAYADKQAAGVMPNLPGMIERMQVKVEPQVTDGVKTYVVTPTSMPAENQDKVLIHVHGGCYVLFPGESGVTEALMMAGFGHYKIISVDYRMPPEAYFPAALDDAISVYKAVLKTTPAKNIAFFGTSAGGALTLEMVLRARELGLPMPGAIAPGTPMSDVTKTGDTFYTNEMVDNVLVSRSGFCDAATVIYAQGHDLHDPLLSPVYGDMHGFPPTILTTGTRDLLLSNTVRVHRKLRQAGVVAALEVFEGESHAQYQFDDRVPEAKEAFSEIAAFFGQHLGR